MCYMHIHTYNQARIFSHDTIPYMCRLEEQRRKIEHLQRENRALKDARRRKDEAFARLLEDLNAAQVARGAVRALMYVCIHVCVRVCVCVCMCVYVCAHVHVYSLWTLWVYDVCCLQLCMQCV
jgi:hypothetical protein